MKHLKLDHRYFLRGGFWLGVLRGLSSGSSFLLALVYAHFLSKETFGEFKFVLSCGGILGALALSGLANAISPAVARGAEGTVPAAFRLQLRWAWILMVVGAGVAAFQISRGQTELGTALSIVALCLPAYSAFILYESLLKGRGQFRQVATFGLAQKAVRDVAIGLAAVAAGTLLPMTLSAFLLPTLAAAYFYFRLARTIPADKRVSEPKALGYGKTLSLFRAFNLALNHVDNVLTFSFFGAAPLAVYGFAKLMPDSLISVSTIVQPMILNKFAGKTYGAAKTAIYKGMAAFAIAGICACALYYFLCPYFFRWFFPGYLEAVSLSRIYALKLIPAGSFIVGLYFHAQLKTRRTLAVGGSRILIAYSSFLVFFIWRTLEAMVFARVIGEFLICAISLIGLRWGEGKNGDAVLPKQD